MMALYSTLSQSFIFLLPRCAVLYKANGIGSAKSNAEF
jgi:hypothetical protein